METPSEHALVTLTTEFIACDLGQDTVILSLADGTYYGLNAVGARIWELLQQQPQTVGQLRYAIGREYDVAPSACAADIDVFLAGLRDRALITVSDAPVS